MRGSSSALVKVQNLVGYNLERSEISQLNFVHYSTAC